MYNSIAMIKVCFLCVALGFCLAKVIEPAEAQKPQQEQQYTYEDYEIYIHELEDGEHTRKVIEFPSYNEPWKVCYYTYTSTGGAFIAGC